MEKTVYSVKELAVLWRCSPQVVYDQLLNGRLQGFKVGRSWRITDDARRAFEQTPVTPTSPILKSAKRSAVLTIS